MGFLTVLAAIGDPLLRTEVCQALRAGGYEAAHCGDADDALRRTFVDGPDLLIVHGALPPHGGHALIRRVRLHSSVPLMMLDASADDEALVRALDLGADDYVPLPCAPSTLGARVRAVLRRLRPREDERRQVVVAGDVTVDLDQRRRLRSPPVCSVHTWRARARRTAAPASARGRAASGRGGGRCHRRSRSAT